MANEEIQRAIEFLVQQQAQYTARLEKDEVRLAELEEYFKMLVELARGADERLDSTSARIESDEVRLSELQESFKILVDLARRGSERQDNRDERVDRMAETLNALGEEMATLSHSMNVLAQRAIAEEWGRASLEASVKMLAELAHRHG